MNDPLGSVRSRQARWDTPSRALPVITMKSMKRIRVAVPHDDDCLRCERILNDAGIPFKLMVQKDSHLIINVGDRGLRPALDALHRADFTATDI